MSQYFLDTDICVYVIRGKYPQIQKRIVSHSPEKIKVSAIVKAELLMGALRSLKADRAQSVVEHFLSPFEIVPFDDSCTGIYPRLRLDLEKKGQSIGPNDLLIAATVLTNRGTLITHNTKEFGRIPDLKVEDWTDEVHE